jgi:SAM-dependent methyltransferase
MQESLKEYYGRILQDSSDLKTNACRCDEGSMPAHIREIIAEIDDEIVARFYGCGSPIPPALDGSTVLDLGCGTGRDAYIASKLVGERGRVIGLDMTDEQFDVARAHVAKQSRVFGYESPNVEFVNGYIEDLRAAGIADDSVDVVLSNCVINLAADKRSVFREIFRVLKPGGGLYFSDVFADRRIPDTLVADPVLHGECLAGAMYVEDFRRLLRDVGCLDFRVTSRAPIRIDNEAIEAAIGMVEFESHTIRAFKLRDLEDLCEDYGQVATYRGTLQGHPHAFEFDDHHRFVTSKPMLVCGNTAAMVGDTRYGRHFDIAGDRSRHHGAFDCAPEPAGADAASGCC